MPNSNVVCTRPGVPSDDDGPYVFSYSPALVCGGSGTFSVTAAGPEGQLAPANGSYTSAGPVITVNFSYLVLESSVPPALEMHKVALQIDCRTGTTTGSLSE